MTPGPAGRKCTPYLLAGPGGMPLVLPLSEGLGISARGRLARVHLHAWDSASRFAPRQEQSRYSASAANAKKSHGAARLAARTTVLSSWPWFPAGAHDAEFALSCLRPSEGRNSCRKPAADPISLLLAAS